MTLSVNHITFDSADPYTVSRFWEQALGFSGEEDEPNTPGDDECYLESPDGSVRLLFIRVPEGKSVKNRLHLDLAPVDGTRDEELVRLLGIGATIRDDRRLPDGRGWIVMADVEGNEFCLERSAAEKSAQP
jgi:catechol 2,3-dioxygenase-like lactoylglutathione lyase family enzyme